MSSEAKAHKSAGPVELWNVWNETTARMWPSLLEYGKEASRASFGLYTFWMRSAGLAPRPLKTSPFDPAGMWKLWTDAAFDIWRTTIETSTCAVGTFYRANEELSQNLQIPTRSDITHLKGLVISLEERVYTIEDAFVDFEDGYAKVTTDQVVEALAKHLERVEDKLETLDTLSSSTHQRTEKLEDLAGRLERVEDKLNILLRALEKIEARAYPEAIESSNGANGHHNSQKA